MQHFKISAAQRNTGAQYNSECCLRNAGRVPIDLKATAHYFKLAVDQSFAIQSRSTIMMLPIQILWTLFDI
jgi:hypothetical protein